MEVQKVSSLRNDGALLDISGGVNVYTILKKLDKKITLSLAVAPFC